jgi:hypothetical protein
MLNSQFSSEARELPICSAMLEKVALSRIVTASIRTARSRISASASDEN